MQSFIVTLFDSNIETNVKVELLKAYTNKDMGQYELTYLVEYFIQTNYPNQPFYNKAMCVCGTGGDQSNSFNISTTVAFVAVQECQSLNTVIKVLLHIQEVQMYYMK